MNAFELYRRMADLSQKEAAKALGVHQTAVSQWETGQMLPRASRLPEVAKLYKTTVAKLLGKEE